MVPTALIQQAVTNKRTTAMENSMAGPISSMEPTKASYIHIASNSGRLRTSRHGQTSLLTACDCPGSAQDHFNSKDISALLFCFPQLHRSWRTCYTMSFI